MKFNNLEREMDKFELKAPSRHYQNRATQALKKIQRGKRRTHWNYVLAFSLFLSLSFNFIQLHQPITQQIIPGEQPPTENTAAQKNGAAYSIIQGANTISGGNTNLTVIWGTTI